MCNRSACHHRLQSNRPSRQPRQPRKPIGILYLLIYLIIFEEIVSVCEAKDYYEVLGVSRDADSSTIKRAFRKLAVKYHPDKNPGDKTAEKMYVELNNAYEVLNDDNKRQRYDMFGEDGLRGGGGGADDDDDDDGGGFFSDFFGGGRRRRRQQENRTPDVVLPLTLPLEVLYNGGVIEASHKRRVQCNSWSDCESKCTRCGGRGIVIQTRRLGPGFVQQIQTACPKCGGKGKIGKPRCKSCPNGQFEEVEKQLLIDIEKGMANGDKISFEAQTDDVPDHTPGTVYFEIDTLEHDRFERDGNDLHYELKITLSEALTGVNRVVKQLDGRKVDIKTTKVISPGEEMVIDGEGMPSRDGGEAGNLVVTFWVKFPDSLTDSQKKEVIALHGKPPSLEETGDGTGSLRKPLNKHGEEVEDDSEKTEL